MKPELTNYKHSFRIISNNDLLVKDESLETYLSEIRSIILSKKTLVFMVRQTNLKSTKGINDMISIKKYLLSNILDEFDYLISSSLNMIEIFQAELKKIKDNKHKNKLKSNQNKLETIPKSNVVYPFQKQTILIDNNANSNINNSTNNKSYMKTETEPSFYKIKSIKPTNFKNTKRITSSKKIPIKNTIYFDYFDNQISPKLKKSVRNLSDSNKNSIKGYLYSKQNKSELNSISENHKYNEVLNKVNSSNISKSLRGILIKNNLKNNKTNKNINQTEGNNKIKKLIDIINDNNKLKIFLKDKYAKGDYNLFLWKLKFGKIDEDLVEKDINLFNQTKTHNYSHSNSLINNSFSGCLFGPSIKKIAVKKVQEKSLKNYEYHTINNKNGKRNWLIRNEYNTQIIENNFGNNNDSNKNSVLINNMKRYLANC